MARWVRALVSFSVDPSSVPSIHVRGSQPTTYNAGSRRSSELTYPLQAVLELFIVCVFGLHVCACTVYVLGAMEVRRGHWISRNWSYRCCEPLCGF